MSTTYESGGTPGRSVQQEDGPAEGRYSVTIFGFGPGDRQQAIECFLADGAELPDDVDDAMEVIDGRDYKNWVEIVFKYEQDAIRAVSKGGNVTLQGGNIIIGAKWTVKRLGLNLNWGKGL